MAGYTYTDYISDVGSALEVPVTNPALAAPFGDVNYNNWLPRAIEAGEQRMYRDLDLMSTHVVDTSGSLTANNRRFTLPSALGTFIVVEELTVLTAGGVRNVLLPTTKPYIDTIWPTDAAPTTPSVPTVWCPYDQSTVFVGPSPDVNYAVEVNGTIRPTSLSASNPTTILTTYLPDMFLAASMISWMGFMRDYGQASDDPKMAMSWEQVYQSGFKGAAVEQLRVRFASQGWSARMPGPLAQPPQS